MRKRVIILKMSLLLVCLSVRAQTVIPAHVSIDILGFNKYKGMAIACKDNPNGSFQAKPAFRPDPRKETIESGPVLTWTISPATTNVSFSPTNQIIVNVNMLNDAAYGKEYSVEVEATWTVKMKGSSEYRDVTAKASVILVACQLIATNVPWLGLDRRDEGVTNKTGKGTATLTPLTPVTFKWKLTSEGNAPAVCILTNMFSNMTEYWTTNKESCSGSYLDQILTATATISNANPVFSISASTNFTVVKLDVTIDGIAETNEERVGAFIEYKADNNGLMTAAGTNVLKAVSITCKPSNLPTNELVNLEFTNGFLYEKLGSVYTNAQTFYTACEISSKQFFLHGHEVSGSSLDGKIEVNHINSGAKDMAKYTVINLDIDVDSDNDGVIDQHNQGEDRYEEIQPGKILTVTNSLSEGAGYLVPVLLSTNSLGRTGIARLEQISDGGTVRVWTNTQPGSTGISLPVEWDLAQNKRPPYALWVDGVTEGGLTLKYSLIQGNVPVSSDSTRLTVIPPASYAPGRKDLVCIWAPLKNYDNLNTNNNVGYMDGEVLASELLSQGFTNVVWYEDLTGDTDLNLGTCTRENYLAMRNAGVFCVTSSHGSPGYHYAVYAPYNEEGRLMIVNWCSNRTGMVCYERQPTEGDIHSPGYYSAKVSSSWMQANWKPWLDVNKAITVWSICNSGTSGWQLGSVKEATGGRWRIGYTDVTSARVNYVVNELFFQYMNGKQGAGLRRTAGKALGSGSEYSAYNVRMDGNPWTTLCPAFIYPHAVFPYSFFPSPGTTASTNVGWGCVLFDTYLSDTGSASSALVGGTTISDVRWINAGTDRKRGIGYDYDKSSNSTIWLRLDPSKCVNDGVGGGRPLVKMADDWKPGWNEWIF